MSVSETIKILCIKNKMSVSKLAQLLGTSPQAFSQKLKRESLTVEDLRTIAAALDCKFEGCFILPNGDKVEV